RTKPPQSVFDSAPKSSAAPDPSTRPSPGTGTFPDPTQSIDSPRHRPARPPAAPPRFSRRSADKATYSAPAPDAADPKYETLPFQPYPSADPRSTGYPATTNTHASDPFPPARQTPRYHL